MIRGTCVACGTPWKVPTGIAGKRASCSACGNVFIVVDDATPAAASAGPLAFLDTDDPTSRPGVVRRPTTRPELAVGIAGFIALMGVFLFVWITRRSAEGAAPGSTADSTLAGVLLALLLVVGLLLYTLPSIIGWQRGHPNAPAIFALNILLGWAFVGWVGALVWALTEVKSREHHHYHR